MEGDMVRLNRGSPTSNGIYVAYIKDTDSGYATKILLMWIGGKWGYPSSDQNYRGKVYAWVGPLPALILREKE